MVGAGRGVVGVPHVVVADSSIPAMASNSCARPQLPRSPTAANTLPKPRRGVTIVAMASYKRFEPGTGDSTRENATRSGFLDCLLTLMVLQ